MVDPLDFRPFQTNPEGEGDGRSLSDKKSPRRSLARQRDLVEEMIAAAWSRHQADHADPRRRDRTIISWDDTCKRWQEEIAALNGEIADFNLRRPFDHLEIFPLNLEAELERVGAPRWLR